MSLEEDVVLYPRQDECPSLEPKDAPVPSIIRQPRGPTTQISVGSIGFSSTGKPLPSTNETGFNASTSDASSGSSSPKVNGDTRGRGSGRRKGGKGRGAQNKMNSMSSSS